MKAALVSQGLRNSESLDLQLFRSQRGALVLPDDQTQHNSLLSCLLI